MRKQRLGSIFLGRRDQLVTSPKLRKHLMAQLFPSRKIFEHVAKTRAKGAPEPQRFAVHERSADIHATIALGGELTFIWTYL